MPYHFFSIRAIDPGADEQALNHFLASHRVVAVRWRWIDAGLDSRWIARVEVARGAGPLPDSVKAGSGGGGKASARIDYREVLSPEDFQKFAAIRTWRKKVGDREGLAVYHILTNEQMAAVVTEKVRTLEALGEIGGFGPARMEKYGEELIAFIESDIAPKPSPGPPV